MKDPREVAKAQVAQSGNQDIVIMRCDPFSVIHPMNFINPRKACSAVESAVKSQSLSQNYLDF